MRICFIALVGGIGGMTQYVSQLANALSNTDNEVCVIFPEHSNISHFGEKIKFHFTPLINKMFSLNSFRFDKLITEVFNAKPDVIHITMPHPWLLPFLFLYRKKYPIISTIHDIKKHPGDWEPLLWRLSLIIQKKYSDKLIVHGNLLKKQLVLSEGVPEDKIVVMPHGAYSFFLQYKNDAIIEENAILFFGRIVDYKGIEYLIKAEPLIRKQFPDLKIIIAGPGDFSKYESLIKDKNNFKIINEFIPDDKVAELFQRTKMVVLPYIEASQSGVIPIGYAFKKPIVATNVGAIPEVIEDGVTGFLVPPCDSKALADAIIKILKDDDLRKQMGENAYRKMKDELSWDKIAEKTIEVYEEAIRDKQCK